jgi:hypothetical protein
MDLKEDLQFQKDLETLSLKIQERKIHITNEETTKQALIIPFLQVLGYDTSNPLEVQQEFLSAWGKKIDQRVDFAILKDKEPIIFTEAKPVNENLVKYDAQLAQYFNAYSDTKFGIVTNGEEYRFFTDTQKTNVMDKTPFLTVNFSNLKESDYKNLLKFKKENYDKDSLCSIAEDLYNFTAINTLFKNLLINPTEPFIRFLIKAAIPEKVITTNVLEKMNPIVKQAISNSILEMTRQGIEDQQKEGQNIQQQKIPETKKQKVAQVQPSEVKPVQTYVEKPIEISDEEMKAFELVKSILQKAGRDISVLRPKDTMSYFSINNRDTHGWFLRLFLKETMRSINVNIDTPNIESLTKGFEIKKYPNSGVTNIIINSIDDLKKLDKLIITCFDEVNKKHNF